MTTQKLSSLQLELLKIYSFQPSQDDLLAIQRMLAEYFSDKFISKISRAVTEKGITEADLDKWLNGDD